MRDIEVRKVYNLVNSNGTTLQLRLGMLRSRVGEVCIANTDNGYRWSFVGKEIPMPVRSGYWFNGFADEIMISWLKGNGWYPRSCVCMDDGKAIVYELPEPSKGNEEYELTDTAIRNGENALRIAIQDMCNQGCILRAVSLYRLVHPCTLVEAKHAVDAIRFDNAT